VTAVVVPALLVPALVAAGVVLAAVVLAAVVLVAVVVVAVGVALAATLAAFAVTAAEVCDEVEDAPLLLCVVAAVWLELVLDERGSTTAVEVAALVVLAAPLAPSA
jgi:hypothetical protein